ncbi:MAG: RNA polymerase sigma factor [Planctomycetota bacterium]
MIPSLTDAQIMERVRSGDTEAFGHIVMRHQKALINYFHRLSWNVALSEDLAQDTFVRIYAARDRYEARSQFSTYMFRVARNLWIDHVRQRIRRGPEASLDAPLGEEGTLGDIMEAVDHGDERQQELAERMKTVMEAVARLNQEQRELFTLSHVKELKYREIALILGIPEGTVKTRMHTLMKRLRDLLEVVP